MKINRTYFYMAVIPVIVLMVLVLSIVSGWCDTPSRLTDGVVEFAYAQVGSTDAWTVNESTQMIKDCIGDCPTTVYFPEQWELGLSSNVYKFENFSDWKNSSTKTGVRKKIMDIIVVVPEFWPNMKAMGYPSNPRIDWLVDYYLSLP